MSIFYIKFTMLIAIKEVNTEPDDEPYSKAYPVRNPQFTHHIKAAE